MFTRCWLKAALMAVLFTISFQVAVAQNPDPDCTDGPSMSGSGVSVGSPGHTTVATTLIERGYSARILENLPANTNFQVLAGPCGEWPGYWYVQIHSGSVGWVSDFDVAGGATESLSDPAGSEDDEAINPQDMLPSPAGNVLMCVATDENGRLTISFVEGSEASAKRLESRFDAGQCTDWLDQIYPILVTACVRPGHGNGGNWDNEFRDQCGFPIGSEPQVGDIAVWDTTTTSSVGHVAYVTEVNSDGTFNLTDYNADEITSWYADQEPPRRPPAPHVGTNIPYPAPGLSFVHVTEGLRSLTRSTRARPLAAEGARSYLYANPENPLLIKDSGLFLFHNLVRGFDGEFFDLANQVDGRVLYVVNADFESRHYNWQNYYWLYVYISRPVTPVR